jgi:Lipase (class 3)
LICAYSVEEIPGLNPRFSARCNICIGLHKSGTGSLFPLSQTLQHQAKLERATTKGFDGLYSQIIPGIIAALQKLKNTNNLSSLFVTGHSLGAALAHLVAAGIKTHLRVTS